MGSVACRKAFGTLSNHLRGPLWPRTVCFPLTLRYFWPKWDNFGPDGPKPKTDHKRPNITQNGARRLSDGRQEGLLSLFMESTWATSGLHVCRALSLFCPQMVSVGLILVHLGPDSAPKIGCLSG